MTDNTPDLPDDFDHELAEALNDNNSIETARHNATIVATYYNTLHGSGVPHESAVELTCQWFATVWGDSE